MQKRIITALRKHNLHVDLHVHCGELIDFKLQSDLQMFIKSMLSAAIIKGLDVIGIVAHGGPEIGLIAKQISQKENFDLYVIAGQEYNTITNDKLLIFNITEKMPLNYELEAINEYAHKKGAFIISIVTKKRTMQKLNKLIGTPQGVDAIEIYNSAVGGYTDTFSDYPAFVNSAAKTPQQLEESTAYTIVSRKQMEEWKLLPKNYGINFTPKYLQNIKPLR